MSEATIVVQPREELGKNASRRLRAADMIPAVVYGAGKETVSIKVEKSVMLELLRKAGGENQVFLLKLGDTGKSRHTMIRDLEIHPLTRQIVHIDFQRVLMTEKIRVQVPVELVGVPDGVKNEGGVLDFVTREVSFECLPGDIPAKITLDVSPLHIGQNLSAGDLEMPQGVELMEDEERVIVSVAHPRVAIEEEAELSEEEALLIEAETEEPEVIGKGKEAKEGEEDEA